MDQIFNDGLVDEVDELSFLPESKAVHTQQPDAVSPSISVDEDDEELPDFDTLIGRSNSTKRSSVIEAGKKRGARRVVDDDSDD